MSLYYRFTKETKRDRSCDVKPHSPNRGKNKETQDVDIVKFFNDKSKLRTSVEFNAPESSNKAIANTQKHVFVSLTGNTSEISVDSEPSKHMRSN